MLRFVTHSSLQFYSFNSRLCSYLARILLLYDVLIQHRFHI